MVDIEKLKGLAVKAQEQNTSWIEAGRPWPIWNSCLHDLRIALCPAAVLELIDELELANARLREVAAVCATAEQERDRLKADNEALRKDAERLNWLEGQHINILEGQTMLDPHGELVAHEWSIRGPFSEVRDAIDDAMNRDQQL